MALTISLSFFFLCLYVIGLIIRRVMFHRDRARMEHRSRLGGTVVARAEEVAPSSVRKFRLICQKYRLDCFLVNHQGNFHAYINRCRHMTTPLDFVRDQFFTEDGKHLICLTHGAIYEPGTGLCLDGPCKGLSLYRLPVMVDQGDVLVGCPQGDLSFLADLAD